MLEIDRDAVADDRLDLTNTPVRLGRMADVYARCEVFGHYRIISYVWEDHIVCMGCDADKQRIGRESGIEDR